MKNCTIFRRDAQTTNYFHTFWAFFQRFKFQPRVLKKKNNIIYKLYFGSASIMATAWTNCIVTETLFTNLFNMVIISTFEIY